MLQQAPKTAQLSGLSIWQSWCATVGQIVGSSAPPEITLPRFVPVIKGLAPCGGCKAALPRRGAADGSELCQAAGAGAEEAVKLLVRFAGCPRRQR
jgi:hypothetical protein